MAGVELYLTDYVVALKMTAYRVGKAPATPVIHVDDFAAATGDVLLQPLQAVIDNIIADFGAEDHNHFVVT
jgi:hypothetical protein